MNYVDPSGMAFDPLNAAANNFSKFAKINFSFVKSFSSILGSDNKFAYSIAALIGFSTLDLDVISDSVRLGDLEFLNNQPYYGDLLFGTVYYKLNTATETLRAMDFVVGTPRDILDWIAYTQNGNYSLLEDTFMNTFKAVAGILPLVSTITTVIDFSLTVSLNRFTSFVYKALTPYKNTTDLLIFMPIRWRNSYDNF